MEQFSSDDYASLIFLSLWGVLLVGAYLAHSRLNFNKVLQQAAIWVFIFLGAIVAVGLWEDISRDLTLRQSVESGDDGSALITARRQMDGHYYLTLEVNQVPVRFVVDTGATSIVLTQDDATRAGLDMESLAFLGRANTANGTVRTAPVRLEQVAFGPVQDQNVRAIVNEGELDTSLLGMSYLQGFGKIEIEGDRLRLIR